MIVLSLVDPQIVQLIMPAATNSCRSADWNQLN
jgi:hypothetical protein